MNSLYLTKRQSISGRSPQRGFALLEFGIALLLVGILGAAIFAAFQRHNRTIAIEANANLIHETVANLQKTFGHNNNYGTVTTALAVQYNAVPSMLRNAGTATAQNSYGGNITVTPTTLAQPNDALLLSWGSVPKEQCADLAQSIEDASRRLEAPAGTIVKPDGGTLNPTTLAASCESSNATDLVLAVGVSAN